MEIIYTGLEPQTLQWLKNELNGKPVFTHLAEQDLTDINKELLHKAGIILIGEKANNPIRLAQQIYQQDRNISVLLINEEATHRKIKQALQFTPFVGPTILCVSSQAKAGLSSVVADHLLRTEQRRSYARIKASMLSINSTSASNSFERIKHQYIDKVLQEAPIGIILLNGEAMIQSFNQYAAEFFNKTEREVLGKRFSALFSENGMQEIESFLKQNDHSRRKKTIAYRSENGQRYIELTLSDLHQKEALPYQVILISDVTHQILSQRMLEESARKVELILESLPQIAWTANREGKNTYLNAQWYEYTGSSALEVSAFSLREFLHQEDVAPTFALWQSCLQSSNKFEIEYRLKRGKDGMYRWMLSRALPIQDEEGKITFWVGTTTDIHDLKMAEKELQRLNEHLAASNEELTAANEELTAANEEVRAGNEELAIANKQLSRVNADMDNFIYTASHDLKAPISNIEGLMKMLVRKLSIESLQSEVVQKTIGLIESSVERFKKTIADLAQVTKLEKETDLTLAEVDISRVVEEVLLDLSTSIQGVNAQVEVTLDECSPVKFSPKNMKSIVYNLVSNAIKYHSPKRKPLIQVSCREEGMYTILCVEDNGLGIHIQEKDAIFSMFKRLHDHVEGTGVGLYIVKKIVDNAGGRIEVESKVDQGSSFKVYFKR